MNASDFLNLLLVLERHQITQQHASFRFLLKAQAELNRVSRLWILVTPLPACWLHEIVHKFGALILGLPMAFYKVYFLNSSKLYGNNN